MIYYAAFLIASTCKYSRLSEVCKGKDCAALSGQCYCDDECHNKPEGCCIDIDEVEKGQSTLGSLPKYSLMP